MGEKFHKVPTTALLGKYPVGEMPATKRELCHRFLSRESSIEISSNHTNCFENNSWEEKTGILLGLPDKITDKKSCSNSAS